jgi:hypothetical protein
MVGLPAASEAALNASIWIVHRLLDDTLVDSVVPTTPVMGVVIVVTVGGNIGSALGVTMV